MLATATPLSGQRLADLTPGVSIRFTLDTAPESWVRGDFVALDETARTLAYSDRVGSERLVTIPEITNLQVQTGTRSVIGRGAGWGIVAGAFVGAIYMVLAFDESEEFANDDLALIGALGGGVVGAMVGGLIGAAARVPSWSTIRLP